MNHLRERVVKAHRDLVNGTGGLAYFEGRGIAEQTVRGAFVGYESGALVSHLAKYRSLMPSLALVFHLVGLADEVTGEIRREAPSSVGVASAARAAAWCEYLESHAHRIYASGESPDLEGARTLLGRIRKGDVKDGDTVRSVYRGREWSRLSMADEVNAAAAVLENYGWLRVEKTGTGGRPTTLLRLHPSLKKEA